MINIVQLIISKQIPIFYIENKTHSEHDRNQLQVIQSLSYSETFLDIFTSELEFPKIEGRFKLIKIAEDREFNNDSNFVSEKDIEQDQFYKDYFNDYMRARILNKQGSTLLFAGVGAESVRNTILFVKISLCNLKFVMEIYR